MFDLVENEKLVTGGKELLQQSSRRDKRGLNAQVQKMTSDYKGSPL